MAKCPHNETVECDSEFRKAEFVRQLNIVLRCGGFWFEPGKQDCRAKCTMCCRLNQARQH